MAALTFCISFSQIKFLILSGILANSQLFANVIGRYHISSTVDRLVRYPPKTKINTTKIDVIILGLW